MSLKLISKEHISLKSYFNKDSVGVDLDEFDDVQVIDTKPYHRWYDCGDLRFVIGDKEVLRLHGVSRPEAFKAACMKSRLSYVGVKAAI